MLEEKANLIFQIKEFSNLLDKQYCKELNFRNHCYLRIAYDNTVLDQWDNVVNKPFVKFATIAQLKNVINLFNKYSIDKVMLLSDNEKSLNYRKHYKKDILNFQNELF